MLIGVMDTGVIALRFWSAPGVAIEEIEETEKLVVALHDRAVHNLTDEDATE